MLGGLHCSYLGWAHTAYFFKRNWMRFPRWVERQPCEHTLRCGFLVEKAQFTYPFPRQKNSHVNPAICLLHPSSSYNYRWPALQTRRHHSSRPDKRAYWVVPTGSVGSRSATCPHEATSSCLGVNGEQTVWLKPENPYKLLLCLHPLFTI